MTFPLRTAPSFRPPTALSTGLELSSEDILLANIRALEQELSSQMSDLQRFRRYYDGEESLVFGNEKLKATFGAAFEGLRDNWCGVVVDAINDRLELDSLILAAGEDTGPETTDAEEDATATVTKRIWDIFRANDIDEQQEDLHEGALVEGRAAVIVWPDPSLGARLDWQPAQNIIVRYSDDDWRLPVMAMKRWVNANQETLLTVYTPRFVYKFVAGIEQGRTGLTPHPLTQIAPAFSAAGLTPRSAPNEPWPLPNPFNPIIPVVEFHNKSGSELSKIIPLQDAINYLLANSLSAAGFAGFPQRVFFTNVKEPTGGWSNEPGRVWSLPHILDAEGRPIESKMGEFSPAQLSEFRQLVEMVLQHAALISKTPVRMFFHSDRGGRGDAPSGESLIVDDEPLLDKVEKRQTRFGNSWIRVARLIAAAANIRDLPTTPLRGEMRWKDPRAKYRSALLAEGKQMWEIGVTKENETRVGIPVEYIVRQLGLPTDDVEMILKAIEEQKSAVEEIQEAELELKEAESEAKVKAANRPQPTPTQPSPASTQPPQPRP